MGQLVAAEMSTGSETASPFSTAPKQGGLQRQMLVPVQPATMFAKRREEKGGPRILLKQDGYTVNLLVHDCHTRTGQATGQRTNTECLLIIDPKVGQSFGASLELQTHEGALRQVFRS